MIARGQASNYTLKAAVSRIDEARASAQVAGAAQYPALNLGGNYQRQNNYGSTEKRSVFAEATYEVDFWGKQRAAADSADALANATVFDAHSLQREHLEQRTLAHFR
ncbi:MAG: TolC family protein [Gammaproteobacteria bacterium]